ncbi:MAG: hypothetical protein FD126_3685, partial [Elusimicrobia bacterium]
MLGPSQSKLGCTPAKPPGAGNAGVEIATGV